MMAAPGKRAGKTTDATNLTDQFHHADRLEHPIQASAQYGGGPFSLILINSGISSAGALWAGKGMSLSEQHRGLGNPAEGCYGVGVL